jgi:AcrR family transcriptional regulator
MENAYRRKKEPEFNKKLILDTAAEIGAEGGWHQLTFQAIADKTGLSKGGIIHHFRNKEELLDELVRQSMAELTEWIIQERKAPTAATPALAYLCLVIDKSNDGPYRKTMKVIIQAIVVNGHYRKMWEDWMAENIHPDIASGSDINSLITILVADGLWYADNVGFYGISDEAKSKILTKLSQL